MITFKLFFKLLYSWIIVICLACLAWSGLAWVGQAISCGYKLWNAGSKPKRVSTLDHHTVEMPKLIPH